MSLLPYLNAGELHLCGDNLTAQGSLVETQSLKSNAIQGLWRLS